MTDRDLSAQLTATLVRTITPGALLAFGIGCGDLGGRLDPGGPPGLGEEPPPGVAWIYVADADGHGPRALVAGDRPAWSPDGDRIAFQRGGQLYVIGSDGAGEQLLGSGHEPAWAPDGARIVFTGEAGITVMNEDGSGATTLLPHGFREDTYAEWDMGVGKPAWSPDGSRIAFEHLGDGDMMPAQLFVMYADGSAPRRVTPMSGMQFAESDPAWSPDGAELLFWSYGYGIASVAATGGAPRSIYQNAPAVAYGAKPVWSPDGLRIAFTANRFMSEGLAAWVVAGTGGPAEVILAGATDPVWSPDGTRIAFAYVVRDD